MSDDLDRLLAAVRASAKYAALDEGLIRDVGAKALTRHASLKAAIKATKGKLHQVAAAYSERGLDHGVALAELRAAGGNPDSIRQVCARLLAGHASTRERLPILAEFYSTLLAPLGPITHVLDLACGLNPLAIPWMPLAAGCRYDAYDVDAALVRFLDAALPLLSVEGHAHVANLASEGGLPGGTEAADVALLLKGLPCLERLERDAGRHLLSAVRARCVIVSFPVTSLGGRGKGMAAHYEAHLRTLVADQPWQVERFLFSTELAFRLSAARSGARHPVQTIGE